MKTNPWRIGHIHQLTTIDARHVNTALDGGGGSNNAATTTMGEQQQCEIGCNQHVASP